MKHQAAPLLELANVIKRFPHRAGPFRRMTGAVTAVAGVTFQIRPGEMVGLVGESGCGKTTLAKLITRLEPVTSGEIRYRGALISHGHRLPSAMRREMQLVFQDPTGSLDPSQRVGAALSEPLVIHRLAATAAERAVAVDRLLEQVGLSSQYARRYPRELSGGERQRVAIARALAVQPTLLILDEPVASLDVYVGAQILDLLRSLQHARKLSYLLISHDLRVVGSMCHTIAVMYLGHLVEWAEATRLFRQPRHPYTELLLESAGLRATGVDDRGDLPSPLHPPSGCAFRTRCPLAAPRCASHEPFLSEKEPGRLVACHFRP